MCISIRNVRQFIGNCRIPLYLCTKLYLEAVYSPSGGVLMIFRKVGFRGQFLSAGQFSPKHFNLY